MCTAGEAGASRDGHGAAIAAAVAAAQVATATHHAQAQGHAHAFAGGAMEDSEEEEDDPDGGMYSEEDVLVVMEFAGLGRAAAIELLREFGGDTEAVLASMYP